MITLATTMTNLSEWLGMTTDQVTVMITCAVGFLCLAILINGWRKSKLLNQRVERLQHDLQVANNSAIGMGQQLLSMEKKLYAKDAVTKKTQMSTSSSSPVASTGNVHALKPTANTSQPIEAKSPKTAASTVVSEKPFQKIAQELAQESSQDDSDAVYDEARQLLTQGLAIPQVIKQCGLSYAEVSLISALQVKKSTAS